MRTPGLAVLVACLVSLSAQAHGAKINVACEQKLEWCTECTELGMPRGKSSCWSCHKSRAPAFLANGTISQCRATSVNAAAVAASADPNCVRADGKWCVECRPNFWFDANYKCVTSKLATPAARTLQNCQKTSRNPDCVACNPDGSCTRCRGALILAPLNAIFINAQFPESKCLTLAALNAEAKSITWKAAVMPAGCIEVDSEFKCNRCKDGLSLTGGVCKTFAQGSKCAASVPFRPYCARCNAAKVGTFAVGTLCVECNGARSVQGAGCRLPCRQLYGIGCRKCNAVTCTERDAIYASGRR